jgi:hypothetical protein
MPTQNEIIAGQLATITVIRRASSKLAADGSDPAAEFLDALAATLSAYPDVGYKVYEAARQNRLMADAAAAGLADTFNQLISTPLVAVTPPSGVPAAPSRAA